MRVLGHDERLFPPFLCFLCETSPIREQDGTMQEVIDTQWNFDPPVHTSRNGRIQVCERCVREMANLLGMRSADEVDAAKQLVEDARKHLMPLQTAIRSLADDITKRTDTLFNLPTLDTTETSPVVKDKRKDKDGS